jgi:hypothetical protein
VLQLPQEQALTFAAIFEAQDTRATRWDIWGAGYVLDEGMGDDSFKDFRSWLIGQGRDVFEAVLADPDSLVDVPGLVFGDTHSAETFGGVGLGIFHAIFGEEPSDSEYGELFELERLYLNEDEQSYSDGDPGGEPWDEQGDDLVRLYPRLMRFVGWHEGP